ncbi:UNVERIFIED_CONTAM: hypothetical protein K2H54_020547 [Gekko kuhli]
MDSLFGVWAGEDILPAMHKGGIQTDSVLSARLQIIRIYIRDDGRLVIEFKTHAKFRGIQGLDFYTEKGLGLNLAGRKFTPSALDP